MIKQCYAAAPTYAAVAGTAITATTAATATAVVTPVGATRGLLITWSGDKAIILTLQSPPTPSGTTRPAAVNFLEIGPASATAATSLYIPVNFGAADMYLDPSTIVGVYAASAPTVGRLAITAL